MSGEGSGNSWQGRGLVPGDENDNDDDDRYSLVLQDARAGEPDPIPARRSHWAWSDFLLNFALFATANRLAVEVPSPSYISERVQPDV